MQDARAAALGAWRAVGSPAVWLGIAGRALSRGAAGLAVGTAIALLAVVLAAVWLPSWVAWATWLVTVAWAGPPIVRGFTAAVSDPVIGEALRAHGRRPEGVHPRPGPSLQAYRRSFGWTALGLLAIALSPWVLRWAASHLNHSEWAPVGSNAVLVFVQHALATLVCIRLLVRSTASTLFSSEDIEASLRPLLAWWPVSIGVSIGALALEALLVEALRPLMPVSGLPSGHAEWLAMLFAVLLLAVGSLFVAVAVAGAFAAIACARLLRRLEAGAPRHASPPPTRTRRLRRASPPKWPWWLGSACGLLLVFGLTFRKEAAYWVLYLTEPEFKLAVADADWSREEVQQHARTRLACAGRPFAVRVLHAARVRRDGAGLSALACAARNDDFAMARLLVRLGDDVNRAGQTPGRLGAGERRVAQGLTPLAHAVQANRLVMMDWLITQGASPDAAPPSGLAPIHVAAARHCLPCIEALKRHGANLNLPMPSVPLALWLDTASEARPVPTATLEALVALGMSPVAAGTDGRSPLHAAAAQAQGEAVDWLLACGADARAADTNGMTPLMHAAHRYSVPTESLATPLPVPDQSERLAVALKLLAYTPALIDASRVDAMDVWRPPFSATVPEAGWSLAMMAAREPIFRRAARAQHKPFDYGLAPVGTSPWHGLKPERVLDAVREMSDAEYRSGLWLDPRTPQEADGLPFIAARHGWVPEMARALTLGLLDSDRIDGPRRCALLIAAAQGEEDMSPSREASWQVLAMLMDAGVRTSVCRGGDEDRLQASVARRSPVHTLQWQVRMADEAAMR